MHYTAVSENGPIWYTLYAGHAGMFAMTCVQLVEYQWSS